ncbi:sigma-54-dependent Fis family transcriptional regulator [Nitrospira defluvii]|uniref:GAF domain-containing protein n=3 Tax=Nitrospira TaxID=1234 RepID=A0AA86TBY6_9BACT|nr:sigma 54-interacting transcriptional regulator [Nitrospira defluvii]CAE6731856.1 Transcriptional regulator, NifA subfamily, Fis Family [Nitrospira defluvii]CAI4031729.1 GAF domain-containing protein [Nitrospira tepida]
MDPNKLPHVMVSTAQQRGLDAVLRTITDGIAQCPNTVLTRIWLTTPNELCTVCRERKDVSDNSRWLHLVASAGVSRDPQADYGRLDGSFHRFPLGERKIGRVATSGEPLRLAGLRGDEEWIADPDWFAREGVRTFAAQPLIFREEVLGVLALFDRGLLNEQAFEWLRMFADYAAVSIANAKAFDEIALLRARLEEENLYLREEVTAALGMEEFVGESQSLQHVLRQVQLVAPTDAAVLVTGESGTGKELVARAIHDRSRRRDRALIKVNCSAVPDQLFESEFFGHVKGSFTGALADRPGRFELADGGTLFLDEIGEVPVAMQAKLLRVLQEGEFERVGDTRTRRVDVRIVAATNRDLKREVEAGRFREDLFYRLSVFPIHIPPLRERREDIPQLALHFIAQSAKRLNRRAPRVTQAVLNQLAAHDWPGNVRELQNVVERAVILSQGGPLRVHLHPSQPRETRALSRDMPSRAQLLTREELKRQERESIIQALRTSEGRIFGAQGAAALLGMKPTTLASRIKALGIQRAKLRDADLPG